MKTFTYYIALVVFISSACTSKQPEESKAESGLIEITKEQFQTENMEFGVPAQMLFESRLSFTGKIVPDKNGLAIISAPVDGMIKEIHVQKGQSVNAGEVILEIGGSTLIDLQQAFTTSSAKKQQLKSDFDRTKSLYSENLKTEKEFLLAESAYKSELANYNALKLKLQNIGLDVNNTEKGIYASTYKITTPIKGQLAKLNTTLGQYVSSQQDLAEIVNSEKTQLQLAVFEKDYLQLKTGQKVLFKTAGDNTEILTAAITRISKILNSQSRSFDCFAELSQSNKPSFIINQLVSAEVIIESDSVYAVPQSAIVVSGNNSYVYVLNNESEDRFLLEKLRALVGKSSNDFVEIKNAPVNKKILISGTYNISTD